MSDSLNYIATDGMFGTTRRLPTMTIHAHDNGTFYVVDDISGRTRSTGHPTIASAVALNNGVAQRRVTNCA